MIKGAWLQIASEEDQAEAFLYFMKVHKIPVEHFEAMILDDSGAKKEKDPHLVYFEIVCFNTLDQSRRDHRKICKQCDTMMLVLETVPLPDLS